MESTVGKAHSGLSVWSERLGVEMCLLFRAHDTPLASLWSRSGSASADVGALDGVRFGGMGRDLQPLERGSGVPNAMGLGES
ncbi:hypothetical protein D779_0597 [Imhoffiella purpurea]|uniref:Uncharacterized protein n=1 Tax=Imhoffiella purpurea TaxID=1249627 RepID=W9V936_9GAMM|nr:hypothetical protein D779_0597 [Imhoffiella purpurea]